MGRATPQDATYTIGHCPACDEPLTAGVLVDPQLGEVKVNAATGKASVSVDPKIVGFALIHVCGGAVAPPEPGAAG